MGNRLYNNSAFRLEAKISRLQRAVDSSIGGDCILDSGHHSQFFLLIAATALQWGARFDHVPPLSCTGATHHLPSCTYLLLFITKDHHNFAWNTCVFHHLVHLSCYYLFEHHTTASALLGVCLRDQVKVDILDFQKEWQFFSFFVYWFVVYLQLTIFSIYMSAGETADFGF